MDDPSSEKRRKKSARKRKPPDSGRVTGDAASSTPPRDDDKAQRDDRPSKKKPKTSSNKPFAGKLFAVSTLAKEAASTDDCDDNMNYKSLVSLVTAGGAQCTSQVSKKVFCVVATQSAIDGDTQRVRKAWKKGKPVVKLQWVHKCLEAGRLLPFENDNVVEKTAASSDKKPSSASRCRHVHSRDGDEKKLSADAANNSDDDDATMMERTVDLGCCCVCHETGGAAECEWCVDCSVNKKKAAS